MQTNDPKTEATSELVAIESSNVEIRGFNNFVPTGRWTPWIILFFSALNVIFLGGKRRAFGIFVAELHNGIFNETSLAELNWIGDSYAALGYLTTTLSTWLIIRYQRRYRLFQFAGACCVLLACVTSAYASSAHLLFLTHTGLHGIGSSLILSTVGLVVNEHFDGGHKYHVLATTLVSGGSVASIVFVQLYAHLISTYGWRRSFLILGVIYFVVNLTGAACFQRKRNAKHSSCGSNNLFSMRLRKAITVEKMCLLGLWTGDRILTSVVTYGMLLNLADYLRRNHGALTDSTSLTLLFAAGEASTYLIGAVLGAVTKTFLIGKLRYVLLLSSVLMSLSLLLWEALASHLGASRVLAYVAGFCLGPSITFLFPAGEEMTSLPGEAAYPFTLAGMGLGMLLSPTMSAVIAQRYKYRWFFLVQGCLMVLKSVFLAGSCLILWRHRALGLGRSGHDDDELLLSSDTEQVSMLKREKSSFQPLPITEDSQSVDNGWDHIDLMDAQEVSRSGDDCV